MSNGDYLVFLSRPISLGFRGERLLLTLAAMSFVLKRRDWRTTLPEAGEVER